jgi:Holliday junction resolvasome RuvABC DNA-binding subunit
LYLASTANDISHEQKRSKVTAEDVFSALNELGFDKYEEPLREFVKNYNADKEDQARKVTIKKRPAPE